MRKVQILAALLVLALLACMPARAEGQGIDAFTFRGGVRFGMDCAQVQAIEAAGGFMPRGETPYSGKLDDQLNYYEGIAYDRLACMRLEYDFNKDDGKLYQFYYCVRGNHAFDAFKELVTDRYGEPQYPRDNMVFIKQTQAYREKRLRAFERGFAEWAVPYGEDYLIIDLWSQGTTFLAFGYVTRAELDALIAAQKGS